MKNIIPCFTCSKDIAINAESCPGCGAKNTYVHPKIKEFIDKSSTFNFESPLKIKHTGTVLNVNVSGQRDRVEAISGLLFVLFPLTIFLNFVLFESDAIYHLGTLMMALAFITLIGSMFTPEGDKFEIDFSEPDSPVWKSSNDEFWDKVKIFLFGYVAE
jgi:hypothetical protein